MGEVSGFRIIRREMERLQLLQLSGRLYVFPAMSCEIKHVHIVDAIEAHDAERAESLMRKQCQFSKYVIPRLRERFGDGPVDFQLSPMADETSGRAQTV
jgi:DNA-binding GntR family transcriptional regulator